mmetsp:Transcript_127401/g.354642  ORF Transcript_127401/g.354642 Transcript_127401/m.354642 type:complete len:309 (+) Transcript_127401:44-970(+)
MLGMATGNPFPAYRSPPPGMLAMAAGPVAGVAGWPQPTCYGAAVAPGMGAALPVQAPSSVSHVHPEAAMTTARYAVQSQDGPTGFQQPMLAHSSASSPGGPLLQAAPTSQASSYVPQFAPGAMLHTPVRVPAVMQPFPPGVRVRLKGVAADSPFAGKVLVVTSDPPDGSGQVRVQLEGGGGGTAILINPALLEDADCPPPPQLAPASPPAAWLEGGVAVGQNGLRAGDQVRLKGQAANTQYNDKVLIVEAADVGDGTGRVRLVVQHETHVARLAIDPLHLELVASIASAAPQAAAGVLNTALAAAGQF